MSSHAPQSAQFFARLDFIKWSLVSALWLLLVVTSLFWNINLFKDSALHLALSEAKSLFQKDLLYRRWAAMHGGVYVPPSETTQPNPFLDSPERDVTTTSGKKLTLVNPAYMIRQIHEMSVAQGEEAIAHLTSLNPIRPGNAADAWEAEALRKFESGLKEFSSVETIGGKPYLRYMGAMSVEKPCLKCHLKQGYKEGDVRGGISVSVPMAQFEFIEQDHYRSLLFWHSLIGLLGLVGITIGMLRISRSEQKQKAVEFSLIRQIESSSLLKRNQLLMQNSHEGIHILDENGRVLEANEAFCSHLGYSSAEISKLSIFDFDAKLSPEELRANLQKLLAGHAVFESVHRRKDGTLVDVEVSVTGVESDGERYLFSLSRDITDRKKAEDEIKHMAFYDSLTGLANRKLMTDRMEQALAHARRSGDLVAICMIDLDGFKQVNDSIGHKGGDQLLAEVARRLQECIRQADTASRFGGDEFALILSGFKKISECEQSLNRIISVLAMPYSVIGEVARVSASIGATIFPNDGGTPDLLLRHADQAMYEAKQSGKNCFRLFNPTQHNQQQANQATLKKIERALNEGQLELYYQPQVNCRDGKVAGMEALIRWNHPVLGMLAPSEFIPLLEHDDLVIKVGEWVIQKALSQIADWKRDGLDLMVSVNISARQLHQSNFVERLQELLAGYDEGVIQNLGLEILETAALEDVNAVAEAVRRCHTFGIHVALDDFGTGFSSLAHLKQLPVEVLKIDQSFVMDMLHNPEDFAIVSGVVGLAKSFRRTVIAEGVETIDHILLLMELGCYLMQGYCLARPMPVERVLPWVRSFKPDPLWKISSSTRPSRSYFELLQAEANHRHWIDRVVGNPDDPHEETDPEILLDYQQCRFGHWYYGSGMKQFSTEEWFRSIEPLHQRIHQTAARLCQYRRDGNLEGARAELSILLAQHDEMDRLLSSLREWMATNYLSAVAQEQNGENDDRT